MLTSKMIIEKEILLINRTMDRQLSEFIVKNRNTDREVHYTHVSSIRPKGRYGFGRDEYEELWDLYCARLAANSELISGLAEIPQDYSMLVVDGDIKKLISEVYKEHPEIKIAIEDEKGDVSYKYVPIRLYTDHHVEETIRIYQEAIREVTVSWQPKHCYCVLLEKEPRISGDYIKSGFHLAFVYYFSNKDSIDAFLIPRVVTKIDEEQTFRDLGYAMSSEVLDISKQFRKAKPWLLYGSRKDETSGVYRVSKAYDEKCNQISLDQMFDNYQIFDVRENQIEMETYEYYYPRIFSVNPNGREVCEIRPSFDGKNNIVMSENKHNDEDDPKFDQNLAQKLATAQELVEMLDVNRAIDRDLWMEIGWILYSIGEGCEEALNIWNTFSQQCGDKYSAATCYKQWAGMRVGDFTLGSLIHYARIDDPEAFKEFERKRITTKIAKALKGAHADLAIALHTLYSDRYVCASLKPEKWFKFSGHRWEETEEGVELRKHIGTDLVRRYLDHMKELMNQLHESQQAAPDEDDENKPKIDAGIKACLKMINNLKTNSFKNSIMKECREVFYDAKFMSRLGNDKYLIALKNGVYDLKNHVFRAGKPEDYITLQMPIEFHEFSELDPWVIEVENFFEKVFPDREVREYVKDRTAELLVGGNKRKHFYMWTGRGNNAKSVMKLLLQKMFGPYFVDIPNSVLVGSKPKSGQACPELARAGNGVRMAVTQELSKNESLNVGSMKEFSGNDSMYLRSLYSVGGEMTPLYKIIMITNELPALTANDPAAWNRIRVIPFESTFTDHPPADEEEQFRTKTFWKDENFDEKIPSMLEPLFWILVKRLPTLKNTIKEPAKVKEATRKYQRSQDVHAQFIDEKIIEDESKTITLMDFYVSFRDWFRQSFPGKQSMDKNDCYDYLLDAWGNPENGFRWKGYRLRTEKDDVIDGKVEEVASTDWSNNAGNPLARS
jgi:P4 family phage/plasmid primase-like protien